MCFFPFQKKEGEEEEEKEEKKEEKEEGNEFDGYELLVCYTIFHCSLFVYFFMHEWREIHCYKFDKKCIIMIIFLKLKTLVNYFTLSFFIKC